VNRQILTRREVEVLKYLADGDANEMIAYRLGISRQTVKNHVSVILQKLNVDNRTQAAVWYHRPKESWFKKVLRMFKCLP